MEQTSTRAHAGWREDEIDQLWREIQQANEKGQPLRAVFEQMGEALGRKPNSVRNYYYMQLRPRDGEAARRAAPFETFTEQEVRDLVRGVLTARGAGKSVRAAVMEMSGGDHARMLRYQNKYRAILRKRPELIAQAAAELTAEGVPCGRPPEPLAQRHTDTLASDAAAKVNALGDADVRQVLTGLNALLDRALSNDPQVSRDRMRVRMEMAQLRYDGLCREAGDMLLLCKEFLGQEEAVRQAALPAFLEALGQRVTGVENAMSQ